jgi:hypothetical protein
MIVRPSFLQKITGWKKDRLLSCITSTIIYTVLGIIIVLFLIEFPEKIAPPDKLDPSWRLFLNHAYEHSLAYGTEVIFTYGPLGFLSTSEYTGGEINQRVIWELITKGWVTLGFILFLMKTNFSLRFLLLGLVLFSPGWVSHSSPHIFNFGLLCWSVVCLLETKRQKYYYYCLFAVFCGLFSLVKFPLLLSSCFLVLLLAAHLLFFDKKRTAGAIIGAAIVTFSLGWILLGQPLLNIPAYLLNSWQISEGFEKSMARYESQRVFIAGAIAMVTCSIYGMVVLLERVTLHSWKKTIRLVFPVLSIGALLFVNWKQGYVRADGHTVSFLGFAPIAMIALTVFIKGRYSRKLSPIALTIVCFSCFFAIQWAMPGLFARRYNILTTSITENFSILGDLSGYQKRIKNGFKENENEFQSTTLSSYVNEGTIDAWGNIQGQLLYSKLNYKNRPIFQSYSAYTSKLQELNRFFFQNDSRPEFLLLNLRALDRHFPPSEDASAFIEVYNRYTPLLQIGKSLLLRSDEEVPFKLEKIDEKRIAWGEKFSLKDTKEILILKVNTTTSMIGKIKGFLYKPPQTHVNIFDSREMNVSYNFNPSSWENGVLINPVVRSPIAFSNAKLKRSWITADQVSFTIKEDDSNFYKEKLTVSLYKVINTSSKDPSVFLHNNLRLWGMKAKSIALSGPIEEIEHGRSKLRAPSRFVFSVPDDAKKLSFTYAMSEAAYSGKAKTDGITFVIEIGSNEKREIWRERLDPVTNPDQRDLTIHEIDLPGGKDRTITLRVSNNKTFFRDWYEIHQLEFTK